MSGNFLAKELETLKIKIRYTTELIRKSYTRTNITNSWRGTQANILITVLNDLIDLQNADNDLVRRFYDKHAFIIKLSFQRLKVNIVLPKILTTIPYEKFPDFLPASDFVADASISFDETQEAVIVTSNDSTENSVNENSFTMTFDIKTALGLVPNFDGNPQSLDQFIDSIDLLNELTTDADQKQTMFKFIKTRLLNKARDVCKSINSFDQLKETLITTCQSVEKSDTYEVMLEALRQKGGATGFADEIKKLTDRLNAAYIAEGIPPQSSLKMANKKGINALINGAKHPQTKLLLKAGNFGSLAEATTKLISEDLKGDEVAQILRFSQNSNGQKFKHNKNFNQNFNKNGNRNKNNYYNNKNHGNNYNNNGNRGHNHHNNGNRGNNHYNNGNRGNNHHNNGNRGNNSVRYMENRPDPSPDSRQDFDRLGSSTDH